MGQDMDAETIDDYHEELEKNKKIVEMLSARIEELNSK